METDTGQSSAESALKELHAYAKLLYLRNGRQFEDKTSYRELPGNVFTDDSGGDGDSAKNIPFGNVDVDRLRREFLDRLSETASSTKGGRYVVASHMFYWPDKAKVFVAINSGFTEGDALSEFLVNLCTALNVIAAAPENQIVKHTDTLWNMLLRHQASRLDAVILDLRQIMKSVQHLLPQNSVPEPGSDDVLPDMDGIVPEFQDYLKLLSGCLFGDTDSVLERHDSLVNLSHTLYRTFPAEHFQALGRASDKLHQTIGFLGRLKTSFRILVAAARQLSGFDDLALIPVVGFKTRKKTLSKQWSPAETFDALNLQLNDTTVGKLMEPPRSKVRWTRNKLINDFSRLKSPTWEVHAEIQLIVFILNHPEQVANGKRFDYIGCSKYSCVLCSKFLHFFQAIKTHGCHGKLYSHSWTVPLGDGLGKDEQHMLLEALRKVISWMRKALVASQMLSAEKKLEAKESTIGGSLVAIPGMSQENRQQSHAASEHLLRERAQNYRMRSMNESSLNAAEHEGTSEIESRHETLAENKSKHCVGCRNVETSRPCSHCGGALFCGQTCERRMPLSHLLKCNMRQVTSADYLYEDVLADEIPTDTQVRQEYWFDRCQNRFEESHLFGMFKGLVHYHFNHLTREELHQWRSDPGGNPDLVAKIVEKFEEYPKNERGGYFPWFLRHRARFELPDGHGSIPQAPSPATLARNMEAKARKYLSPEDRHKDFEDLTPFAKMHCFGFYAIVASHSHPPPINSERCYWFDFGFVVSQDQHEQGTLGSMYNEMLFGSMYHEEYARSLGSSTMAERMKKTSPTCSFDEFWKAWERGKLMTMFDKCWPGLKTGNNFMTPNPDLLTRLRAFLEAETPRPSIWKLRHFLAMEDVSVESAIPETAQGARDYGFSELLDTRTTMELRDFYLQLFKESEPLAIHRETMAGALVQFAEDHVDSMTPRVKELLQGLQ